MSFQNVKDRCRLVFGKFASLECFWMPMFSCHILSACYKTLMPGSWNIEVTRSTLSQYFNAKRLMIKKTNSSLWKRVIAWERSRAASGYGIIWGEADRNKQGGF